MAPSMPESTLREIIKRGLRAIDAHGRRLVQLDEKDILVVARRRTGWHEFGDDAFREPLRRLLHSIDHEAQLNFFGRIAAREDLTRMLCSRLRIERDRKQHPDIANEDIRWPVFITGLPRTGSTLLQGLLAQDPVNRVPLHWEVMHPSPPPERATYEVDRRINLAERQIGWFHRLAPGFRKIHPVSARLPQECTVLLSHSFLSFQFSTTFFVPSYQEWMEAQDLRPAYRFHRQFLQQLQWRCRGERWVLKAPPHLPGLRALSATYPDAVVIMTHRDPLEVVASIASLHTALRRAFSDAVDAHSVGPEVSEMLAGDIRRGLEARDAVCLRPERFLDVWYSDLVAKPLETVRRIYKRFDLPLTPTAEARMQEFLAENPQHRYGRHEYSLAQFGLEADRERERYRVYRERFGFSLGNGARSADPP